MEPPYVFSKTVDHLMAVFSRIKDANGTVKADLLHEPSEVQVLGGLGDASISVLYQFMLRLKSSQDALRTVLELIDGTIESLQERTLPLQKRVTSLPDELLRRILEVGYEDYDDGDCCKFALRVSGVSRHFRRVALDSPRIWRRLDNKMSADILTLLISRSKNAGLHINFTSGHYRRKRRPLEPFMDIVITESPRWAALSYDRSVDPDGLSILHKYPDLQLPRLSSIGYRTYSPDVTTAKDALDVFTSWYIPQLHHLSVYNGFIHVAAGWAGLTSCALELDDTDVNEEDEEWDICAALHGLTALVSLESLSLKFSSFEKSNYVSSLTTPLALPHLKSLLMTFEECDEDSFITPLVRGLHFPGLFDLTLNLGQESFDVECFLPGTNPYPSLQRLILKGDREYVSSKVNVALLVHKLPCLTSITVEGLDDVCFFDEFNKLQSFPLQNVSLTEINELSDADVIGLSEALIRGPSFQRLEIINCGDTTERRLRKLKSRLGRKLVYLVT